MALTTHPTWAPLNWGTGSAYNMGSVSDGLSNTVILSERCATPDSDSELIESLRGGVYGDGFDVWNNTPSVCMATKGANGQYVSGGSPRGGSGMNFAYYRFQNGYFHTIIPPNGPSCSWTSTTSEVQGWSNQAAILPPTSFHTGGVNACLGDGSVRFISETIGYGDLTQWFRYRASGSHQPAAGHMSDPSPFGPWGALGSMNGGESNAL
jgi:prepilin-type processing-associated H-X9-DG protein